MPVDFAAKKNAYVYRLQQEVVALLDALDDVADVRLEWDEAGYAAGGGFAITDADLAGSFPALDAQALTLAMASIDAFLALRDTHGGNLTRLRP